MLHGTGLFDKLPKKIKFELNDEVAVKQYKEKIILSRSFKKV